MKKMYILESAEEVIRYFNPNREEGDEFPFANTIKLNTDGDGNLYLIGESWVQIKGVTFEILVDEMSKKLKINWWKSGEGKL